MYRITIRGGLTAAAILIVSATICAGIIAAPSTITLASARLYKVGTLTIESPWTRATPGGARVAGGYVRITNTGSEPDRLIGATLSVAGRAQVHEMAIKDGIMTMRPLDQGLTIEPGQSVALIPGGSHLMFLDLQSGLKQGEQVKGTLTFERAGTVEVDFAVAGIGETGAPAAAPAGQPAGGEPHRHP